MSKIVFDFAYTEQHGMQKKIFDHRKAQCCVSKANPPWNFARKIEAVMSFKFAKKLWKKRIPPPLRPRWQGNYLDSASVKDMRSPPLRSLNSTFCPPLLCSASEQWLQHDTCRKK